VFGLVVSSVLVSGLVMMNYTKSLVDQFTFILLLATLTTLVPYAYAAAAEAVLLVTDRERFAAKRLVGASVVTALGFAYAVWVIIGAGTDVIAKGFILLLLGIPVYVIIVWTRHRTMARTPEGLPLREVQEVDGPYINVAEGHHVG
jgi:APA family basic amino acid/polyamine antiporter